MAYFLKMALGFAHSGRVRQIEGKLQAEILLLPAFRWRGDRLSLRAVSLPGRIFSGHAYQRAPPPWLETEAAVRFEAPSAGDPRRADLAALRRFLFTPFGAFCRHPEVRLALAQDRLAAWLAPFLCAPDLLGGEDKLFGDWEARRPAAAADARASAAALGAAEGPLPGPLRSLRQRLRTAALRRLDAAAVGREVFQPCPLFFGEPYGSGEAADDGPPVRLKAGIVVSAQYWPKLEAEARSAAWRTDEKTVAAAERSLFPFLPPAGPRKAALFSAGASLWQETASLREFEARSELPLFPTRTIFPEGTLPPGFRLRIRPETMRACGGSYRTLAAAELSPYIAEAFLELCGKYRDLLAAWTENPLELAAAKWAAPPPPTSPSPAP